jgi:hypothetical protein
MLDWEGWVVQIRSERVYQHCMLRDEEMHYCAGRAAATATPVQGVTAGGLSSVVILPFLLPSALHFSPAHESVPGFSDALRA